MARSGKRKSNLDRLLWFVSRCTPTKDLCWEYKPHKYSDYIQLKTQNCEYFTTYSTSLHRFVYAVYYDKHLTQDDVIMHTCDNRICINPKHLQLGTIQTNNAMRARRLRAKKRTK